MSLFRNGNWGLKLLALVLAIVIYHALKTKSVQDGSTHDRTIFQSR